MRMLNRIVLGGAALLAATSATAQTYDPRYPVCLQKWEWGGSTYFDCAYSSWDQCKAASVGLPAMCLDNPYWSRAQPGVSGRRVRSPAPY